ncbi:ankyrin repeat-containing domain protein [Aspergillus pseudodeflectus]|uniref:Ankyrin repeat-containing domain protein n=1 Tax=Aspergillus pseudodeflectus TaxID=176178 RepID=A0ABR4KMU9_9EURO
MQPKNPTSLGDLPSELLLKVKDHLNETDRNALARTNREIYGCINYILYRDNIRHGNASALRWAVTNNMESTVHMCLEQGATTDPPSLAVEEEEWMVRSRPCFGDLALINIAAAKGYDAILELFLDNGADPNVFVPGAGPPLSLAIEGRRTSTFRLLLSHNKIDAHSRVAYTDLSPMYYALEAGSLEFVQALIAKGANIRIDGGIDRNVIQEAVLWNSADVVRYLVEHEFGQDDSLAFYLPEAAAMGHSDMVIYILSLGVDPDQLDASERSVLQALLDHGSDPTFRDDENKSPLYLAVASGNEQAVQLLLENGIAPDTPEGASNYTPLLEAVYRNHLRVMDILLEYGAGLGPDAQGKTPLDWAFNDRNTENAVIFLIERGAKLSSETDTLLTAAARKDRAKVMQFLLDNKWDPSLPDRSGKAPLVHAVMNRHYGTVDEYTAQESKSRC